MSRFRLLPSAEQERELLAHCRDARYVWNLAVEQQRHWQPGRRAPGYGVQAAQLTDARAEYEWLRAGSQTVQQQALRDFAQAMRSFFNGTHHRPNGGRPEWMKGSGRCGEAASCRAAESPLRSGMGAQGGVGEVRRVASGARWREVLPGYPRPR
ncbi:MAG: helix-turn-helix domain-containing protein [Mycobacterium sp.]